MNNVMAQQLLNLKALQDQGELMYCPRCGRESMDEVLHRNAISRHVDLHICPDCGTAEAMLEMMQNPMPIHNWAALSDRKAQDDLKTLSMAEVMGRVVNKHIPILTQIHIGWIAQEEDGDFGHFYQWAMRECPGLHDLRSSPFSADYQAKDGKVVVRFRFKTGKTEIALDTLPNAK